MKRRLLSLVLMAGCGPVRLPEPDHGVLTVERIGRHAKNVDGSKHWYEAVRVARADGGRMYVGIRCDSALKVGDRVRVSRDPGGMLVATPE